MGFQTLKENPTTYDMEWVDCTPEEARSIIENEGLTPNVFRETLNDCHSEIEIYGVLYLAGDLLFDSDNIRFEEMRQQACDNAFMNVKAGRFCRDVPTVRFKEE